jgi:protein arginine kinase
MTENSNGNGKEGGDAQEGGDAISRILKNRVSWLADSGPDNDIAISTRIRFARNLEGAPFPVRARRNQLKEILETVRAAAADAKIFDGSFEFDVSALRPIDKKVLFERRLISRELMTERGDSGLIISLDESRGVMINEEDHIRLQSMGPGLQLKEALEKITAMDNALSSRLPIAFSERLGFLTSCPTNVGTGMRASVMLHLPGLVLTGQIAAVVHGAGKLGMAVRGIFGEGTDNLGNLFQVSNQSTLGESEDQITERLETVIRQIINHEKNVRQSLLDRKQNFLLNHVGRAYGTLRHAYIISSDETLNSLSALRLGVDMGMFSSVDIHTVNELFLTIQPAHLQKYADKELVSEDRDVFRASLLRDKLRSVEKKS